MYLLGLGVVMLTLKLLGWAFVAQWSWWVIATPFALAVAWWGWADSSGYTKRKAMERESQRAQDRKDRTRQALGQLHRPGRHK